MRFFYSGISDLPLASIPEYSFISASRLWKRKTGFHVKNWILDSGAFTEISRLGHYAHSVNQYAELIKRFQPNGCLQAAVAQDYMCEPFILKKTSLSTQEHQKRTVENYVQLCNKISDTYVMPVLQGYAPEDYVACIELYGPLLRPNAWVGVGSVCKRNTRIQDIFQLLYAIQQNRPDLRLHGFGLKKSALEDDFIRNALHTSDSMAWCYAARKTGERKTKAFLIEHLNKQIREIETLILRKQTAGFFTDGRR